MQLKAKIDFARLLGFGAMGGQLIDSVHFQDDVIGAKLGAKVGSVEATGTLDLGKLLGFASISDQVSNSVDFQDDTIGAKLGAKVGAAED